jgi:predicted secreted protein
VSTAGHALAGAGRMEDAGIIRRDFNPIENDTGDVMGWVSGIAVYLIIWWVVIFAVLPWGVQSVGDDDVVEGQERGAPKNPRILMKMAATTVVAGVIWAIVYLIIEYGGISLREI